MTREMLQEKSLNDLREIAKLQGVKSLTKYRKNELVDIITTRRSDTLRGAAAS